MKAVEFKSGTQEIPARACYLLQPESSAVELQEPPEGEGEEDGKVARHRFTMNVHTGKPILGHWFWGNLVIDLAGVQAKPRLPALKDHDTDQRVGFTESVEVVEGKGVMAEGRMLKTSAVAQEILADAADGFPWQASPKLVPMRVQLIDEGEEVEVNGHTVQGPGAVFRESVVREVSFTALGADDDTTADAFRADEARVEATFYKEDRMSKKANGGTGNETPPVDLSSVDPEELATYVREHRDNFADLFDDRGDAAASGERSRVSAILKAAHPTQVELAQELVSEGVELADALARLNADLRTRFDAASAAGVTSDDGATSLGNTDGDDLGESDDPESWASEFQASRALQTEFGQGEKGLKLYLAFKRNEHRTDVFSGSGSGSN